ncbi:MAG: HK97 gp10 family phage protein [Comamonas sp.]|uniref:HK97-gp10 family putative phage morphogenesis protein n=1 Tax=Comamonas sp. TaxID=34028 RepID=UPI002FC6B750
MPFTTVGITAEIEKFDRLAQGADAACEKAVKAGAKLLAQRISEETPIRTGALAKSIKPGSVNYSAGDGYTCEVAPKGNHPKTGEPLAKIGNIVEHGRSNMAARPFFVPAVKKAEPEVVAVMQAELQKAQGG